MTSTACYCSIIRDYQTVMTLSNFVEDDDNDHEQDCGDDDDNCMSNDNDCLIRL